MLATNCCAFRVGDSGLGRLQAVPMSKLDLVMRVTIACKTGRLAVDGYRKAPCINYT